MVCVIYTCVCTDVCVHCMYVDIYTCSPPSTYFEVKYAQYTYIHAHTGSCLPVNEYTIHIHIHIHMHTRTHMHTHPHACTYTYTYTYTYTCIHVHIHICIHIHMHAHTHTHTHAHAGPSPPVQHPRNSRHSPHEHNKDTPRRDSP